MLFRVHFVHNGDKHSLLVDKPKPSEASAYVRTVRSGARILKTKVAAA